MGKYFLKQVDCEIPGSKQHDGAYGDGDLLFDWQVVDIPKGAAKLVSAQMIYRGTDTSIQGSLADLKHELYFAKSINNVAPVSMSNSGPHATLNGQSTATGGFYRNLIGAVLLDNDGTANIDKMHIGIGANNSSNGGNANGLPLILQGEPDSGINVGYDRIYVCASVSDGAPDFSTNVFTTESVEGDDGSVTSITIDNDSGSATASVRTFQAGDTIITESDIVLGVLKSVAATTFEFESGMTGGDLVDSLELYNHHPIVLQLGFER